ncbi:MAG: Gfo/Idh/MocA family oxidoreductase [Anaerosporomusa subterranea]|jgi:predicted dehydrogenase|nr:Gfo/Idh/MocA family oxidoreductase [Anaerosporomusa subterranea]
MTEIRWGMIGCGDVTEVKSGPGFQKASHSRLVAVMRRNGKLAEDYARRHGVPKWYSDADSLIADPDVDAVYVATPPAFHKDYAIAAARAGKPVYVEKPMALTFADCKAMLNVFQSKQIPLFVAYYRRAMPRFLKVKELLDGNAIGAVRFVQVSQYARPSEKDLAKALSWRVDPQIAGGGYFYDMGSHTIDFLDFLFGPIAKAQGYASNQAGLYAAEDTVAGSFVFKSGLQGAGTWCFAAPYDYEAVEIIGEKGRLIVSMFANLPVRLITGAGEEQFMIEHPAHVQQPLIETVVNELLGLGNCLSSGITGARVNWVMEQMVKRIDQ